MFLNIVLCITGIMLLITAIRWDFDKIFFTIVGLAAILLANTMVIIPSGYTGVRMNVNGDCKVMKNKFCLKIPFAQKVTKIYCHQQDSEFNRLEAGDMTYDVTVTYQVNPDKAAWVCANVKYSFQLGIMPGWDISSYLVTENIVSSSVNKSASNTTVSNLEPLVMKNLQNALDKKYEKDVVLVKKVTVSVNATENPILSYPATGEHSGKTRTWRQD